MSLLSFVSVRFAAGARRAGEADRREQDVRSKFTHGGQRENGLVGAGVPLATCHPAEQRSGQRLRQPNRFAALCVSPLGFIVMRLLCGHKEKSKLPKRPLFLSRFLLIHVCFPVLSNGNSPLTPSARISALNIVSDLLRKVGVSHRIRRFS